MTDHEAQQVQQAVQGYLNGPQGYGFDIGKPQHFAQVVAYVRARIGPLVEEDELRTVGAMCVLHLNAAEIPPAAMGDQLVGLLRHYVPQAAARIERVMEFAIAYGCGKWRIVQPGHGGWEQRWPGAEYALTRAVVPAVEQANRWLARCVVGFPQGRNVPENENFPEDTDVWSDARRLVVRLTRAETQLHLAADDTCIMTRTNDGTELLVPTQEYQSTIPPGAKAVWTIMDGPEGLVQQHGERLIRAIQGKKVIVLARDEDALLKITLPEMSRQIQLKAGQAASMQGPAVLALWECTCGTVHCLEQHRLAVWEPHRMIVRPGAGDPTPLTLWDFVASAVKGPQAAIQTGSFVEGMYFPLLAWEGV